MLIFVNGNIHVFYLILAALVDVPKNEFLEVVPQRLVTPSHIMLYAWICSISILYLDAGQRRSIIEMSGYVDNLLITFIWGKM